MEWKDATTYSQSCKGGTPTVWSVESGDIRITITCGHIDYRGEWVMHCHGLGMSCVQLNAKTKEEAKKSAVEKVRNKLSSLICDANLINLI